MTRVAVAGLPVKHLCPFKDEVDIGSMTASWTVAEEVVELHALVAFIDGLADIAVSHEHFTERVASHIRRSGGTGVKVSSTWFTAGLAVTVDAES